MAMEAKARCDQGLAEAAAAMRARTNRNCHQRLVQAIGGVVDVDEVLRFSWACACVCLLCVCLLCATMVMCVRCLVCLSVSSASTVSVWTFRQFARSWAWLHMRSHLCAQ